MVPAIFDDIVRKPCAGYGRAATAHALPEHREELLDQGVDGYPSKPFTVATFGRALHVIDSMMATRRPPSEEVTLEESLHLSREVGQIDRYKVEEKSVTVEFANATFPFDRLCAAGVLQHMLTSG